MNMLRIRELEAQIKQRDRYIDELERLIDLLESLSKIDSLHVETIIGSLWENKRTNEVYEVIQLFNEQSNDDELFPRSVLYRSVNKGAVWGRPVVDFMEKNNQKMR